MRIYLFLLTACFYMSCSSGTGTISERRVLNDTIVTMEPFDTLAAYRKMPGQAKSVDVRGYYRKDSTYVAPHKRTPQTPPSQ